MLFLVNSCVWSLLLVSQSHKKRRCHYRRHSGGKGAAEVKRRKCKRGKKKKMFFLLLPQRSLSPSLEQAQHPTVIVRNNCPQQLTWWTSRLNSQPKYLQSIYVILRAIALPVSGEKQRTKYQYQRNKHLGMTCTKTAVCVISFSNLNNNQVLGVHSTSTAWYHRPCVHTASLQNLRHFEDKGQILTMTFLTWGSIGNK